VLATSDVPGGVANVLWGDGRPSWRRGWPTTHDVDALDISGVARRSCGAIWSSGRRATSSGSRGNQRVASGRSTAGEFLDLKTVWHPARV
jgi:prepilin-type processing-associated H-X9-DG protein